MVVSSTWQGQTSFQRMVGFEPKPTILSVVKLDDLTSVGVDFEVDANVLDSYSGCRRIRMTSSPIPTQLPWK